MTLVPNSRSTTIFIRRSLFVLAMLTVAEFSARQVQAAVYYVSTTGSQNNSGTSWSQAFKDLQETFVLAQSGDQVWVKQGTYTAPNNFTATDGVAVYGGFAGTETNIGQRNISANPTILTLGSAGAIYTVPSNATGTNMIDGFIIENGQAAGLYDSAADTLIVANCTFMGNGDSGIYTRGTSTITNCIFTGNSGVGGGGISGDGPSTVTHCTFTSNTVSNGGYAQGGGYYDSNPCTVTDCTFTNNTADESGGGVYVSGTSSTVTDCTFTGNSAVNGGGLFATGAADISLCTFDTNSASGQGGGVYETGATTVADCLFRGSRPDTIYSSNAGSSSMFSSLKDNLILGMGTTAMDPDGIDVDTGNNNATSYITIANNTIVDTNVGINFNASAGAAGVANNILYGNDVGLQNDLSTFTRSITLSKNNLDQNSIQYNGVPRGSSDLFDDPLFVSTANSDYQLESNSPLINAGDDGYVLSGDIDLDGHARIQGAHVDIGCYETATPPAITSIAPTSGTAGTVVTITGTNLTGATVVSVNGVNVPFTVVNSTTITFTVPAGLSGGVVSVTTPGGTATSGSVTFTLLTWTAKAVGAGPSGTGTILWTRSDGAAGLWVLGAKDATSTIGPTYGPYTGWTAKATAMANDGTSRVLWTNTNGMAGVWTFNDAGVEITIGTTYGPYAGWSAQAVGVAGDGTSRVLWTNTNGEAGVWSFNVNDAETVVGPTYGPYSGWTAKSLATATDGTSRVLWDNANGEAGVWSFDANDAEMVVGTVYGPYSGWTAQAVGASGDGTERVLWTNTNGEAGVWSFSSADAETTIGITYGPYTGWVAGALSTASDGTSRVLWINTSRAAGVWTFEATDLNTIIGTTYGPY